VLNQHGKAEKAKRQQGKRQYLPHLTTVYAFESSANNCNESLSESKHIDAAVRREHRRLIK